MQKSEGTGYFHMCLSDLGASILIDKQALSDSADRTSDAERYF